MSIFDFAKLSVKEKLDKLNKALFVDQYSDGTNNVNIYFLDSFFVEAVMVEGQVKDLIPYQRGFRTKNR